MDAALFFVPQPPAKPAGEMSPLALAYMGDAVYELFIRQHLLSQENHRPHHLQKEASRHVSAKAQARAVQLWLPLLSEEELAVLKRGRNAKSGTTPKHTDVAVYHQSTAFECLLGYLYYKQNYERLQQLMQLALTANPP